MNLIEVEGCVFDKRQLSVSHGFESLDPVGREAFVNHMHFAGDDRENVARQTIESWTAEMRSRWPNRTFRIYRQAETGEITLRFHVVRPSLANWCEGEIEIITVAAGTVGA
jgi:hypothetical protein